MVVATMTFASVAIGHSGSNVMMCDMTVNSMPVVNVVVDVSGT